MCGGGGAGGPRAVELYAGCMEKVGGRLAGNGGGGGIPTSWRVSYNVITAPGNVHTSDPPQGAWVRAGPSRPPQGGVGLTPGGGYGLYRAAGFSGV